MLFVIHTFAKMLKSTEKFTDDAWKRKTVTRFLTQLHLHP